MFLPLPPPPLLRPSSEGDAEQVAATARVLHDLAAQSATVQTGVAQTAVGLVDGYSWCGPLSAQYLLAAEGTAAGCQLAAVGLLSAAVAMAEYARELDRAQALARAARARAEELAEERSRLASRWQSSRDSRPAVQTPEQQARSWQQEAAFAREAEWLGGASRVADRQGQDALDAAAAAATRLRQRLSEAAALATLLAPEQVATAKRTRRWRDEPWRQVSGLGRGLWNGVREPAEMVGDLTGIIGDASDAWRDLGAGIQAAASDPWSAVKALIPLKELRAGEVGYAVGNVLPSALATVYTGGAAAGLKGGAAAVQASAALRAARQTHARRLAASGLLTDAGILDVSALLRGAKIPLLDGREYQLTPEELAVADEWAKNAKPGKQRAAGAAGAYQDRVYPGGEVELGPRTFADGINPDFLAIGDAKLRDKAQSWYVPDSLPPAIRAVAMLDMEKRLLKYKAAINDSSNPARVLEISTNDLEAGRAIEDAMRRLGVPGYVVHRPWENP